MKQLLLITTFLALMTGTLLAQPTVNDIYIDNSGLNPKLVFDFSESMNNSTFNSTNIKVHSSFTGYVSGTYSTSGEYSIELSRTLFAGEEFIVTLSTGVQNSSNVGLAAPVAESITYGADDGSGSFDETARYQTEDNPNHVISADLNKDGYGDLAVLHQGSELVSIRLSNGDGTFGTASTYSVGAGLQSYGGTFGDVDGDGYIDLLVATNSFTESFVLFTNDGDGTFTNDGSFVFSGSGTYLAENVELVDLDADGDLDLFASFNFTNDGSIGTGAGRMLNDGTGSFSSPSAAGFASSDDPDALTTGDFDGDGDIDVAVGLRGSDQIKVYFNNGSGGMFSGGSTLSQDVNSPRALSALDIDEDGDLDLAVANHDNNNVIVFENTGATGGTAPFAFFPVSYSTGASTFPIDISSGDVDDDGDQDLIVLVSGDVRIMNSDGAGNFSFGNSYSVSSYDYYLTTSDFNGDETIDFATAAGSTIDSVTVFQGLLLPEISSSAATAITTTTVTLNGSINAKGNTVDAKFTYKLSSSGTYADTVSATPAQVTGSSSTTISADLTGLSPNTSYDFKALGSSEAGDIEGSELTFSTSDGSPVVATGSATDITQTTATLDGTVNALNSSTTAYFEYGTSSGVYTTQENVAENPINDGENEVDVTAALTGLTAGTTYYYRLVATNSGGTTEGSEGSFTTSNPIPTVTSTTPASNAYDIETDASIDITFSEQMLTSSISTSTIKVVGSLTGSYSGKVTNSGNTATFDPTDEFFPGEKITVTVTTDAESNTYNESLAQAYNFSFEVSAEAGFGSFAATTDDYSTGSAPHEVAVGDFNNDGFMDVVSTNQNANTISVNINDGDGTFASSANYSTGTFVQGVKVGDLNGDGNLDIAVTHISSGVVGVFINSGTGTFGSMVSYSSGTGQDLEIFDADGDGDLDIVQTGTGIKMLANNGDGTFASAVTYGSDSGWGITSGDLDGDGAIDVITSDYSGQAIRVYQNNGDGTFASATAYSAGMSTSGIKTADIDGDGDLDVLVTNYQSDNIGVYLNNGDGTLASAATTTVSDGPYDLDIADIDGDGDLDVAMSFQPLDKISIMYNDGSGNFGTPQDEASGDNPRGIALADLNGDNSIDVATANNFGDNISVLNKEVPAPQVSSVSPTQNGVNIAKNSNVTVTFDVPISISTLIAGNIRVVGSLHGEYSGSVSTTSTSFTFDPSQDFEAAEVINVTVGSGVQNIEGTAMENPYSFSFIAGSELSDGLFRAAAGITSSTSNTVKMLTSDFDSDNDLDLLTFYDSGGFYYHANDGSGGFASAVSTSLGSGAIDDATLVDIDLDGDLDILGAHNSLGRISRLLNDGDGTFSGSGSTTSSGAIAVAAGDIDRDGYPDAVVANQSSNEISVLINNQSGGFFQAGFGGSATYSAGTSPNEISVGDFDNDGDLDIVSSNSGSGNVSVFLNNGDGTLAAAANYGVGTTPSAVSSADVDGDGYADLLVSNSATDNISVLINDGDGTYATAVNYTAGDAPSAVNPVDIDGDGDIDLLVANADSDNITLLSNNGDGTFAAQVNYGADDQPTDILAFDYDEDGDLDIFTSNYTADNVTILKRTGGPAVLEIAPTANAHFVPADSNITVKFNSAMSAASLTTSSIVVSGSLTGKYDGSVSYSDSVATYDPSTDFAPGEKITVTVTTGVQDSDTENMEYPYSWSFTAASTTAAIEWTNTNLSGVNNLDGIVSADLDGDDDNDLVVSETQDGNISVFLNNGSGSFASAVDYTVGDSPKGVQAADVDNDGDVDLAVVNSSSNNLSVLINNGDGSFATAVNYSLASGPSDVRMADLDGDGYADLVATYNSNSVTSILINDGDGTFGTASDYSGAGMIVGDLEIADMDGDGAPEIIKRDSYSSFGGSNTTILIWKNIGGGVFADRTTYSISGPSAGLLVTDVDKDGYLDIAYADNANDQVNIFINNGDGTIPTTASSTISVGDNPKNLTGGDFDGDGDIDISTANDNSNNVSLILNNGNGTFGTASTYSGNSSQSDITASDLDGDGQIDLAVSHSTGINLLTPLQPPATSASNVSFFNNYGIEVRTSWTNGSGSGRIVVMKEG
ncbi:MAG: FG-GAP-like repeat-containing protein, partial [Gracilimonas sp.]|nr:FG-GAP-like repeat-containing protein [Gracilimonas sp.]